MVGVKGRVGRAVRVAACAAVVAALVGSVGSAVASAQATGPVGRLEILMFEGVDVPDGPQPLEQSRASMVPLDGSDPVPVDPASVPEGATSGDVVALTAATADPNEPRKVARVVTYETPPLTVGTRDLLVVPVWWPGASPPGTGLDATLNGVRSWYAEASRSRLSFETEFAPVMLPSRLDFCGAVSQSEVAQPVDPHVRQAGTDPDSFENVVYVLPHDASCDWYGMAEFHGPRVLVNGGRSSISGIDDAAYVGLFVHELGHSLGLTHSGYLACANPSFSAYESLAPIADRSERCGSIPYGDEFNVMGDFERRGNFTGVQQRELGWLADSEVAKATTVETVTCVQPLTGTAPGTRLLEVPIDGAGTVLIENRQPSGVDADLALGRYWEHWQGIQLRVVTDLVGLPSLQSWEQPHRIGPMPDWTTTADYGRGQASLRMGYSWTWAGGVTIQVGFASGELPCIPVTVTNPAMPPVPAAATAVEGVAGNGQVSLGWTPPAGNRFPVQSYTATASPGGASCATTTTSCTITGLTNGTAYTFRVTGSNATGAGAASAPSPAITPRLGARYTPVVPTRIQDSRADQQVGPHNTPWPAGETRKIAVRGGVVPNNAEAIVANVTVTGTTAPSFLTVWPSSAARPLASSLVWRAGETVANAVTVKLGADGAVEIYNLTGNVHVIVDIVGYYTPNAGAGFTPLAPRRITDSRPNGPQVGAYGTPWRPNDTRDVKVTGAITAADGTSVPDDAVAVLLNVTVTATTAPSYLAAWPAGGARPLSSSLGWAAGETRANAVTVKVGAGGQVTLYNLTGNADVVIDVVGYYRAGSGTSFFALDPVRVQDSRPGGPAVGVFDSPWIDDHGRAVRAQYARRVRLPATALALNVTVTGTTGSSFLTVWPAGLARPLASSLNWDPGQTRANAVTVATGVDRNGFDGSVFAYNLAGTVDVIADLAGYYA